MAITSDAGHDCCGLQKADYAGRFIQGGQPMNIYWFAFLRTLPKMLIAAYISVLIFLPLSMKVSGMDKLGGPPPKG